MGTQGFPSFFALGHFNGSKALDVVLLVLLGDARLWRSNTVRRYGAVGRSFAYRCGLVHWVLFVNLYRAKWMPLLVWRRRRWL